MADDYVQQLAALTGLRACPGQGPYDNKAGAAIGERDGYMLAIGPAKVGDSTAIGILVRFPKIEQPEMLKAGLKEAMKGRDGKAEATEETFIQWMRTYSFGKPKAQEIADLVPPLLEAVKKVTPGFGGKCEVCRSAKASEITLLNGAPGYYCSSCQQQVLLDLNKAGQTYEELEPNHVNGIVFGAAAALGGSLAWGGVAYAINRIFLWGAIGIGALVGWAVVKGTGKVTLLGQIMIGLLTVASVLFGDVVFYTLIAMKELDAPFSMDLMKAVMGQFWEIESSAKGGWASVLFGLGGAAYAVYQFRKPKFAASFQPLKPV